MAVESGDQFKDVSGLGPIWVVQRILTGTPMIPHAILTQKGDANAMRTLSLSALEDRSLFKPVETIRPAAPVSKSRAFRGLFRLARKAG